QHGMVLLGGDTTASDKLSIGVSVLGTSKGRPVLRSAAQDGDDIWVSGDIGGSARGLKVLSSSQSLESLDELGKEQARKHLHPTAQVELGIELRRRRLVNAMIDVSDGLVQDLQHIALASGFSASLQVNRIPFFAGIGSNMSEKLMAITGGEDYELLFTAAPEKSEQLKDLARSSFDTSLGNLPNLTRIGRMRASKGAQVPAVFVLAADGSEENIEDCLERELGSRKIGFQHFPIG
ncbi:hypothetical protein BVY02_01135, partial [bacterium J17]